ncbi:hypothetical protein [Archangium lansingense]|uniref:Uncharacterized protein n=1 Tax=Archangium lansingense TaxID=2995310 RepID=A0ABT4A7P0_9BACT|nr:hypothetical protein [Archangium lansinium]MCY1077346.1 hypothetical protein [Archangium lansinium]
MFVTGCIESTAQISRGTLVANGAVSPGVRTTRLYGSMRVIIIASGAGTCPGGR